ncbi:hypothetical protein KEM54_002116 [Ascosphaera aggregata]|nr:hypothetical protein KEM54_002116 [Ascosphaera aggregata]
MHGRRNDGDKVLKQPATDNLDDTHIVPVNDYRSGAIPALDPPDTMIERDCDYALERVVRALTTLDNDSQHHASLLCARTTLLG